MRTSFILAAIAVVAQTTPSFNDEHYLAMPAAEKVGQIWAAVVQE